MTGYCFLIENYIEDSSQEVFEKPQHKRTKKEFRQKFYKIRVTKRRYSVMVGVM